MLDDECYNIEIEHAEVIEVEEYEQSKQQVQRLNLQKEKNIVLFSDLKLFKYICRLEWKAGERWEKGWAEAKFRNVL